MRQGFSLVLACAALISVAAADSNGIGVAAADSHEVGFERPYMVNVENVSGKVGEKTALVARLTVTNGYKILDAYRNRVVQLSSYDDGVDFEQKVVLGKIDHDDLVFVVSVTPTKPGAHPINGLFRVGYHNGERMDMVSLPLIATVTGTK